MSETKEKWLYTFNLDKEIEVEKTEEQEVNGEKVKITKKVKERVPVQFSLKQPHRKLIREASMFYGEQLSEGIRRGLLTKALLLKRYREDGGALSEADTRYFDELSKRYSELEIEHGRLNANMDNLPQEERETKIKNLLKQKTDVIQQLQALESINQALFAHTAEARAQAELMNWWIVYLSYWDKDGNGKMVEFFPGKDYEAKMETWDSYSEAESDLHVTAMTRFALLVNLWNSGARTTDDFKDGEASYTKEYDEAIAKANAVVEEARKEVVAAAPTSA